MESESFKIPDQSGVVVPQLPITEFAHKAGIVSDECMCAVVATHDMAAESRRAAVLDRRHHF